MKQNNNRRQRQQGFTLLELMIGIFIGLITMLAIYQVYSGVEQTKRNVVSTGDMQSNGLYALFSLQDAISNAGVGFISGSTALATCADNNYQTRFRPLPLAAVSGNSSGGIWVPSADSNSDQLFVLFSAPRSLIIPVPFQGTIDGTSATISAPPFQDAFLAGDRLVFADASGCASALVTSVGAADPSTGTRSITFAGGLMPPGASSSSGSIINLGQDAQVVRALFWLGQDGVLRRRNLITGKDEPLIANVARFQLQYGIGAQTSDIITDWVAPGGSSADGTAWTDPFLATSLNYAASAQRIKAVRIGLVIQADTPDKALANTGFNATLFSGCPGVSSTCPPATAINIPAASADFGWRYHVYETIVPLINNIWH